MTVCAVSWCGAAAKVGDTVCPVHAKHARYRPETPETEDEPGGCIEPNDCPDCHRSGCKDTDDVR